MKSFCNNKNPMAKITEIRRTMLNNKGLLFDFGLGDPVESTPKIIIDALSNSISDRNPYPRTKGLEKLRYAASRYIKRRYNIELNIDSEIAVTSGSKEGIFHLPLALSKIYPKKKFIIYGTPGYPSYESGCRYTGYKSYPIRLEKKDDFKVPFWLIPEQIAKETLLLWCNYPHNPTGAIVDLSYLKDLYAFCTSYEIIIGSDDCYADLWHTKIPPCITQVSLKNVISFQTCSKRSGMTGLRSGFIYGDKNILKKFLIHRSYFGVLPSTLIQNASIASWNDDKHVISRRESISQKANIMIDSLSEKGLIFHNHGGGIFLWGKLPNHINDVEYFNKCIDKGILVLPSSFISASKKYIRIALSPTLNKCKESMSTWPKI
jgi:succinyldiaminopimelate transaminase